MKKTRIFIVRHTETIGNVEKRLAGIKDYEITENGEKLIDKLTRELRNIKFDKIYITPIRMAMSTKNPSGSIFINLLISPSSCHARLSKNI